MEFKAINLSQTYVISLKLSFKNSVILSLSCGSAAWQIVTLSERSEVEGEVPRRGTKSKDLPRSFM
jgi:hypothetical protein